MDIKLPDSWLRDYLKTSATPQKIAEYVSLCGPSVEKIEKQEKDYIYSIEITTNRIDSAGVYGLAREIAAILPRFDIKSELLSLKVKASQPTAKKVKYINAAVDYSLCPRFTVILIRDVIVKPSPDFIISRLKAVGVRPINNVVDTSNYLMHELGQPVHTFDYDKIKGKKMILRASKKGEKVTTLDGKTHTLPGEDIVIEDGEGRLIDLAGIMGGQNSAVSENTKNVLLFVQNYNPTSIRKTSMSLAHRSEAASLFEKGLDPELVEPTLRRGIDLFVNLYQGKPENTILDLYPNPYKPIHVKTNHGFITEHLGMNISKQNITNYLTPLGFAVIWNKETIDVTVPSWRSQDVIIPEDIVEEIARMYGYHNLPSEIMPGKIPDPFPAEPFSFEWKVKNLLKGWGGKEVYTLSLVSKNYVGPQKALKLKNPLGTDSEYLRTSLMQSLIWAAEQNLHIKEPFHLFEMSSIYIPHKNQLPEERLMLGGILMGYIFEQAKGIVESLLEELRINAEFLPDDDEEFLPNHRVVINYKGLTIGCIGELSSNRLPYYELNLEYLRQATQPYTAYIPLTKYPPQIEDITLVIPRKTYLGEVIKIIQEQDYIVSVEIIGSYDNAITVRVAYQNPAKTLTDKEVEKIRKKLLQTLEKQFGVKVK